MFAASLCEYERVPIFLLDTVLGRVAGRGPDQQPLQLHLHASLWVGVGWPGWEWDGGGFLVTCRENNNSVFIPAAGVMSGKTLMNVGSSASYWSNSLSRSDNESNEYISCLSGSYISGFTPNVTMVASSRYLGFPIRPVCDL